VAIGNKKTKNTIESWCFTRDHEGRNNQEWARMPNECESPRRHNRLCSVVPPLNVIKGEKEGT